MPRKLLELQLHILKAANSFLFPHLKDIPGLKILQENKVSYPLSFYHLIGLIVTCFEHTL